MRKVFLMSLNPGRAEEYQRRHSPIWPELTEVLQSHGVIDYPIHLDPDGGPLIGVADIQSEAQWAAIAQTEVGQNGGSP